MGTWLRFFFQFTFVVHADSTLTVVADYESRRGGTFVMQLRVLNLFSIIFEWKFLHSFICYYPDVGFLAAASC